MWYTYAMQNQWKKLTQETMQKMLAEYDAGEPTNILCKRYGVCRATVTWHTKRHTQRRTQGRPRTTRQKHRQTYLHHVGNVLGMSRPDFLSMYRKQRGKCALCRERIRVRNGGKRGTVYCDHSHETGKVRGLLCSACNMGLGHFKDSAALLLRASTYVILGGKT